MISPEELIEFSSNSKTYLEAYDVPWKITMKKKINSKKINLKDISIAILSAPCNGFGDIVFAIKLKSYLMEWYNCKNIKIVTTRSSDFEGLGENPKDILHLVGRKPKSKKTVDCRRFQNLRLMQVTSKFDILFIAPLQADFDIDISDIRHIFPYANYFNTYFFSEYNDVMSKKFDFPTGIGSKRMGLMLTSPKDNGKKIKSLINPYVVIYIAESITRSTKCFISFIEMVVKKYGQLYKDFDIVVAPWIETLIRTPYIQKKLKFIFKTYSSLRLVSRSDEIYVKNPLKSSNDKILSIRGDVLPLTNIDMIALMRSSEEDILLTGDQSITDALSCCYKKNIFYQIASWKENFASNLSKELPQKFLKRKSTTCGSIKAINFKSDFKDFVDKWDFRKLARPKLDAIMYVAKERLTNIYLHIYENIVLTSKNLYVMKGKVYDLLDKRL